MGKGAKNGFTLIELSIVLVIIGLLVGGVLVGQDLIKAAEVRAQITQIEKFDTAANTFYGKYGGLPGDIPTNLAAQFGFSARGQYAGEGDGNGVLEGVTADSANSNDGLAALIGETAVFWVDLSTANLINGGFSTASESSKTMWVGDVTTNAIMCGGCDGIALLLPSASIGNNNSIYVYSFKGANYYGLSVVSMVLYSDGSLLSVPGITVNQAYAIDSKVDDGLPQSGRVTTIYINSGVVWPLNYNDSGTPYTTPVAGSSTSCYDNGNVDGVQNYSLAQNNGAGVNCALSFRMQAGD